MLRRFPGRDQAVDESLRGSGARLGQRSVSDGNLTTTSNAASLCFNVTLPPYKASCMIVAVAARLDVAEAVAKARALGLHKQQQQQLPKQ